MFDGPIASLKHKLGLALRTTIGLAVALGTVVIALGFFCAALFLWIARDFGPIVASLVLGGAFLAITVIALLVVLVINRRPPPPPPPPRRDWWQDPAMLATMLDIGRTLGRRRTTAAVLVAAVVLGVVLARPPRDPEN